MGDSGEKVFVLQYFINVLSEFYPTVPEVQAEGEFDKQTFESVEEIQRNFGLPVTGIVDEKTWDTIYDAYKGIVETVFTDEYVFPEDLLDIGNEELRFGMSGDEVRNLQQFLNSEAETNPTINKVAENGFFGRNTRWAVSEYQKIHNLTRTGMVDERTRQHIVNVGRNKASAYTSHPIQFPGRTLKENDRDRGREG